MLPLLYIVSFALFTAPSPFLTGGAFYCLADAPVIYIIITLTATVFRPYAHTQVVQR
jgi:hypothetical protein